MSEVPLQGARERTTSKLKRRKSGLESEVSVHRTLR